MFITVLTERSSNGTDFGLLCSSYEFLKADLEMDHNDDSLLQKTFPNFGLEWEANFTLTMMKDLTPAGADVPILIISGTHFEFSENIVYFCRFRNYTFK